MTVSFSPEASLTITVDKLRSFLQGLRGFWLHRFLKKKKATFPVKKRFLALFLSFHQTYQSSGNNFWGSKRFFDSYCGSYIIISSGLERLLKTQFLKKKTGNISSEEKLMAPFLSFYRVSQTSKDSLLGSSRFFHQYCGCYMINSLGPSMLLKTYFFWKKSILSGEKKFLAYSSSFYRE